MQLPVRLRRLLLPQGLDVPFFRFLDDDDLCTEGALRLAEVDRFCFGGGAGPRDLVLLRDGATTEAGTAAGAAAAASATVKFRENAVSSFAAITEAGMSSPKGTFRFFSRLPRRGEERGGHGTSAGRG